MDLNILFFVSSDHSVEPLVFPLEQGRTWKVKMRSY